jgi:uncharacterized OB-fold protein
MIKLGTRFAIAGFDPILCRRQEEIQATVGAIAKHFSKKALSDELATLQAECAIMGHVRFAPKAICIYCGYKDNG